MESPCRRAGPIGWVVRRAPGGRGSGGLGLEIGFEGLGFRV